MNFFNVLSQQIAKEASNSFNNGGKESILRSQLQTCTYADNTKYMIEKAVKQVFHVYPFFSTDILMFVDKGQQRRYIQLKGILQIEIKTKICKVDFNMMLPNDFPRTPPFVRIVNRNPDYMVDPFYVSCKSKTDPTSYVLNEKLQTIITWDPSKSIVNVIIECYNTLRNNFPFTKPKSVMNSNAYGQGNSGFQNNPWKAIYNANTGGGMTGLINNQNQGFSTTNNYQSTGFNQNYQGGGWNNGGMSGGMNQGGMGGGWNPSQTTNAIAAAQKYTGNTKKILQQLRDKQLLATEKIQYLDILNQSLQSEEQYLRKENYDMGIFLKENEREVVNLNSLVAPKDALSEQILDTMASVKAREQCVTMLQSRFNDGNITFDDFLKYARRMQQQIFDDRALLGKCLKNAS